jgi:hypothetical protein
MHDVPIVANLHVRIDKYLDWLGSGTGVAILGGSGGTVNANQETYRNPTVRAIPSRVDFTFHELSAVESASESKLCTWLRQLLISRVTTSGFSIRPPGYRASDVCLASALPTFNDLA